jgi:hypothetical protein
MTRACCPDCGETLMGEFRPDPTDRTWVCVFCMKVIRQPAWMSKPASETHGEGQNARLVAGRYWPPLTFL